MKNRRFSCIQKNQMEGIENQMKRGDRSDRAHTPGSAARQSEQEEEYYFDQDSVVLRRADADDTDAIINLVEIGEDDIYNRVYSYPKILKLIETSYLAITVIDRESGAVVGFAAFEDFPQGQRGMTDDKHYNLWEEWFKNAYRIQDFTSLNTLWLSYFITGGSVGSENQHNVLKQVFQTVYTSLPELIGILFLVRGDADEDDIRHCFEPISGYFQKLALKDREQMATVRGIHKDSEIYFSSRVHVVPYIEIRKAKQEDHDDLADVFNSQSETVTEAYGEYFIAELIASQNENNQSIVAQVKDKAVGLMGLTKEVDLKLLHKCFELDTYDNLLKPHYMDAIRARRAHMIAQQKRVKENEEIAEKLKLKYETMKCNIISQRICLQEHLLKQSDDIMKNLEDLLNNEEEAKNLTQENVFQELFRHWLAGFQIYQPSDYFLDKADNVDLVCNIQSEYNFMVSTLEIFGLPQDYLNGGGHFANWSKEKAEGKDKKKAKAKKVNKQQAKMAAIRAKQGFAGKQEEQRPTHFDLQPIQKALKKFFACNAEARSQIRTTFAEKATVVRNVFKDSHGEASFKKVMDVHEFSGYLTEAGILLEPQVAESLGSLLLCFGDIEVDRNWGDRAPPETEEQKKARILLQLKLEERKKAEEERQRKLATGLFKPPTPEEEEKKILEDKEDDARIANWQKICKPKPPIKQMLNQTSIHDFLLSLDRMAEYDRMSFELQLIAFDNWQAEDKILLKLGRSYSQPYVQLQELPEHTQYSNNHEIQSICEQINDLTTIPDPVESAKNAFAITLFCMESTFDSRSKDFLKYAFDLFPDRDYLIVTQPHTIAENALLSKFTIVGKKSENTFSHVLYILHRDQLYEQDMSVSRANKDDLDQIQSLIESSGITDKETQEIMKEISNATTSFSSQNLCFCARIDGTVIASFLISKDVNLEYYISHFHLQDQLLLSEHDRKGHSRLVFSTINPIFEQSTRFFLKEILRLSGKSCLYFEVMNRTIIPTIFYELVHVRSRRFPHFLDRKWDHERHTDVKAITEDEDADNEYKVPVDGADRKPDDEEESPFALCFTTKRLLSEAKIVKNARVVIVGASDTGISFAEALLSITYLQFTNITLIAPGGLPHHNLPRKNSNLKVQSTNYTSEELKKLMLESRITVLNSRMVDIDRSDKNIILNDGRVVPYDTLILAMGIQEKTLDSLKFASWGINPEPAGIRRCRGVLSIDDPYIYETLDVSGPLMQKLTDRRRQTKCIVYGRTLNVYTTIQGLIDRGVQYKNIILAIPRQECHVNEEGDPQITEDMPIIYQNAFDDLNLEEKTQKWLEGKGVTIIKECKLIEIITDKDKDIEQASGKGNNAHSLLHQEVAPQVYDSNCQLERIVLKRLDIPDEEEEEDEIEIDEKSQSEDNKGDEQMEDNFDDNERSQQDGDASNVEKKKKRKKNELEIECSVLITAGHRDVDYDVFNSIHNNGLVYNGRLIVDKNFQTTDPSIFAAGSLCEFSGRYAALSQGRSLRMDRYNGREMGSRLANSVFDLYDPQQQNAASQNDPDELPQFYLPSGQGGILPNNLVYYHIKTTNPLKKNATYAEFKNRPDLVCDNLDISTGKGHYIRFSFNSIGLIDTVTYMGHEEVILQSLWSFVGLHENYLNSLTSRFDAGIIPNVVEFLSENWAIGLYHEWFGNFCLRMREGIKGLPDVIAIIIEGFQATEHGQGITREQIQNLRKKLDSKTVKYIEDETLEFIKTNMNHLPMYYIPGKEFA